MAILWAFFLVSSALSFGVDCSLDFQSYFHRKRTQITKSSFLDRKMRSSYHRRGRGFTDKQKFQRLDEIFTQMPSQDIEQTLADLDVVLSDSLVGFEKLLPDSFRLEQSTLQKSFVSPRSLWASTPKFKIARPPSSPVEQGPWLLDLVQALFQQRAGELVSHKSTLPIQRHEGRWRLMGPVQYSRELINELRALESTAYALADKIQRLYPSTRNLLPARSHRPGYLAQSLNTLFSSLPIPSRSDPLRGHRLNRLDQRRSTRPALRFGALSHYASDQWRRIMWPALGLSAASSAFVVYDLYEENHDLLGLLYRVLMDKDTGEKLSAITITESDLKEAQRFTEDRDLRLLRELEEAHAKEVDPEQRAILEEAIQARKEIIEAAKTLQF